MAIVPLALSGMKLAASHAAELDAWSTTPV